MFSGVLARCAVLRVHFPGLLGSCSPLCPLGVCLVACTVPWAPWLLFNGVPTRCAVLRVRCPGPLGSCSPVCSLGVLCWVCGVLGHLAPVHGCARWVCCVACAIPWATWLLFTAAPLGVLCCVYGVPGPLAAVHRCARSVCCFACAVSWVTWLLFTGVCARCVVLRVRCPGPLGSCSHGWPLGVLCWVCGVLGHLAPVHRCARSVCCAVGCVCAASLRGANWFMWTAAVRSWQGLGTLRACTCPSVPRLFRSQQGLRTLRVRICPSGRRLFRTRQGLGSLPGAHTSVRMAASVAWHLFSAVVRCLLCALSGFAAPGGRCYLAPVRVPRLWPAACLSGVFCGHARCAAPRPVRSLSVLRSAFPTPWCLSPPRGLAPPALLGGCAGHGEAGREPGSLCLPLAPAEAGALGSLRVAPVRGPAMGLFLAAPSGFALGLRALRWLACVNPVTDASGPPYCPSFDGGLGRCIGAVLCGRRDLPLRVRERHTQVRCVCACACPSWPGRVRRPPGRILVRLTFPLAASSFRFARPPSGWGCPFLVPFFAFFLLALFPLRASVVSFFLWFPAPGASGLGALFSSPSLPVLFFFFRALPLSLAFSGFRPRVPWALALCDVCFVGLPLFGSSCALAPFVFSAWPFAAPWWLLPPPPFVSSGF